MAHESIWAAHRARLHPVPQPEPEASLEPAGHWVVSGGPAEMQDRKRAQRRFRTFAAWCAKDARLVPRETADDDAVNAWLHFLKERCPDYYTAYDLDTPSEFDEAVLPRDQIDPPASPLGLPADVINAQAAHNRQIDEQAWQVNRPPRPDALLVVERIDDRYRVVEGQQWWPLLGGQMTIRCRVVRRANGPVTETGILEQLYSASVDVCEQLEADAELATSIASPGAAQVEAEPLSSPPTEIRARIRRAAVQPRLDIKGWSATHWAERAGVDKSVAHAFLQGRTGSLRSETRKSLAEAVDIPVEQFPD